MAYSFSIHFWIVLFLYCLYKVRGTGDYLISTYLYIVLCFSTYNILDGYKFQSRCHHAIQLGECPISPMGVFPKLIGIRYCDKGKNEFFEDVKDDIFTYCSAKKIVLTNDSGSLGWIVFYASIYFFYTISYGCFYL